MGTKSEEKKKSRFTTRNFLQWGFLTLFTLVAIALAIPGVLAQDDGFLTRESDKVPTVVKVGWNEAFVEGLENTSLKTLFSSDAKHTGKALFAILVLSCACACGVLILGSLGFCFDVWFARTAFVMSCLGALAGITLLFLAPKFANEVEARLKIRTKDRMDVICNAEIVCQDVFDVSECEGRHTEALLDGEKLVCSERTSQGSEWVCQTESGEIKFEQCDTTNFLKDCSRPGVVCAMSKGYAYRATLGVGLHWLLFGMIAVAIFIPKINLKPEVDTAITKPV